MDNQSVWPYVCVGMLLVLHRKVLWEGHASGKMHPWLFLEHAGMHLCICTCVFVCWLLCYAGNFVLLCCFDPTFDYCNDWKMKQILILHNDLLMYFGVA